MYLRTCTENILENSNVVFDGILNQRGFPDVGHFHKDVPIPSGTQSKFPTRSPGKLFSCDRQVKRQIN